MQSFNIAFRIPEKKEKPFAVLHKLRTLRKSDWLTVEENILSLVVLRLIEFNASCLEIGDYICGLEL